MYIRSWTKDADAHSPTAYPSICTLSLKSNPPCGKHAAHSHPAGRRGLPGQRPLYHHALFAQPRYENTTDSLVDTLPSVNGDAAWSHTRQAKNWQDNGFVGSVTSSDIRCNQLKAGTSTLTVAAGSSVKVSVNPSAYHPGPFQSYLARVPDGVDINTWDPTGAVWFRIYAEQPKFGSQLTWLGEFSLSLCEISS